MNDDHALALGRALLAALSEKAEEEQTNRRERSRIRRKYPAELRLRLLLVQEHRCARCLGPLGYYDSHVDHIVPLAAGGSDVESNLQLLHANCNLRKAASTSEGQEMMPWAR